jgi:hypothetical protein
MGIAASMTWLYSVTLGILFAIHGDGKFHFDLLLIPAAYDAPVVFSSLLALIVLPFAFWSIGNGVRRHLIFGPILWIAIAVFECAAPAVYNLVGAVLLAVLGLVALRVVPATK